MMDAGTRIGLLANLGRVGAECRERAARCLERSKAGLHFQQHILLALSTLEHYSTQETLDATDLRLLARTSLDAAAVCRTQPPDEDVIVLARRLEEIGKLCERALGQRHPADGRWRRFLFRDFDVTVRRDRRHWHAQHEQKFADDTYLDSVLSKLWPSASPHTIGKVTIQILDWFERAEADALGRDS